MKLHGEAISDAYQLLAHAQSVHRIFLHQSRVEAYEILIIYTAHTLHGIEYGAEIKHAGSNAETVGRHHRLHLVAVESVGCVATHKLANGQIVDDGVGGERSLQYHPFECAATRERHIRLAMAERCRGIYDGTVESETLALVDCVLMLAFSNLGNQLL